MELWFLISFSSVSCAFLNVVAGLVGEQEIFVAHILCNAMYECVNQ